MNNQLHFYVPVCKASCRHSDISIAVTEQ